MFSEFCGRLLPVALAFLVLTPMVAAQQTVSSAAPVPPQILNAHRVFVANGGGSNYFETFVNPKPQVVLSIRDPRTNVALWSESANVRAWGTKKGRDRRFDQSVAVLVDKLAVVTGQPLTDAQTKAIAGNSKMPTAAKVFIVTAIAGAAAIAAVGIHMATSQHTPPLPPVPAVP